MGNCFSSGDEKDARERSYAIDKQIEEDSRKFKKECKILLLGESLHSSRIRFCHSTDMMVGVSPPLLGELRRDGGWLINLDVTQSWLLREVLGLSFFALLDIITHNL